ncbi:MAG: mechanosensitive ion channel [Flavobacteriaceae bacterium]|nr:MAG: mechanosensitive ion channel [Flavobacteriaceae bacterium]
MNFEIQQMITSSFVILIALIAKFSAKRLLERTRIKQQFQNRRKTLISKVMTLGIFFITTIIILGIWEVHPEDLSIYLASVFTIIGVAFFAQWSHLSNITAAIIIYFNHPVAIGDKILVQDEKPIQGKITDIGLFVTTMIMEDKRKIIFANTLFLQKILFTNIDNKKNIEL